MTASVSEELNVGELLQGLIQQVELLKNTILLRNSCKLNTKPREKNNSVAGGLAKNVEEETPEGSDGSELSLYHFLEDNNIKMSHSVELHPFGSINWFKERQDFMGQIDSIRACLCEYLRWSKTDLATSKLLLLMKNRYQNVLPIKSGKSILNQSICRLKEIDIEGKRFVSRHIQMTNIDLLNSGEIAAENQALRCALATVDQLQATAGILKLQCHTDISLESGIDSTNGGSVFINDDMFYLEVCISPDGNVKEVKISHLFNEPEDKNPETDPVLTKVLFKKQYGEFREHVRLLKQFYLVGKNCRTSSSDKVRAKLYRAMLRVENDLDAVLQAQIKKWGDKGLEKSVKEGYGMVTKRQGGYFATLVFFVSPLALRQCDAILSKSHDLKLSSREVKRWLFGKLGNVASIELEEGPSECSLGLKSCVNISPEGEIEFQQVEEDEDCIKGPFRLSLKLHVPIASCLLVASSLAEIQCHSLGSKSEGGNTDLLLKASLTSGKQSESILQCEHLLLWESLSQVPSPEKENRAGGGANIVFSKATSPKIVSSYVSFGKREGTEYAHSHEYHLVIENNDITSTPAAYLKRVPFCRLSELPEILSILRQQLTFNTLYSSFFDENCKAESGEKKSRYSFILSKFPDGDSRPVFEVSSKAPCSIAITCRHPLSTNIICLEIHIGERGRISTKVHCADSDKLWCDQSRFEKLVSESLNIPLALEHFMSAAHAVAPEKSPTKGSSKRKRAPTGE